MSSKNNLTKLSDLGIKTQRCHYDENDALASEEDLTQLFELLSSHKDSQGKCPVITANVIMTNPDFDKIKAADFTEYHYEVFTETLDKYPNHKNSFKLWKEGIKGSLFYPQYHGREHLNVMRWMKCLKDSESETRKAFNAGVFGLSNTVVSEDRKSHLASYDWDDHDSRDFVLRSIPDGLSLFEKLFGFKSLSSIAPNYYWHYDVEQVLRDNGVRYIQGSAVQKSPIINGKQYKKIRHFTGQKNDLGQWYLVRNCKFEPSSDPSIDWVNHCLNHIRTAFFWGKPAIIESHRVNYIGFIHQKNRDKSLQMLDLLLKKIIDTWPEVEFMTSDQLGKLIEEDG
ncbi:hypothetical protein NC796_03785 [Aliifodinibius sp. S!AR15-10]|nr:hypothetical protein [Aliifodinibius sp. S!AR15-10]